MFFDFIAGNAAAYRTTDRGQRAAIAAAEAIANQAAQQGTSHCANACRFGLHLNHPHCFNRAA